MNLKFFKGLFLALLGIIGFVYICYSILMTNYQIYQLVILGILGFATYVYGINIIGNLFEKQNHLRIKRISSRR